MNKQRRSKGIHFIVIVIILIIMVGIALLTEYTIPILCGAALMVLAVVLHQMISKNQYRGKYVAKALLTPREEQFYKNLKRAADRLGLSVLAKVRMADLVQPTADINRHKKKYYKYFGKIKAKHVDFVLCDPQTLAVRLLIELDDSTHNTKQGIERDEFVEQVYRATGYKLLRVYDSRYLEQKIGDALGTPEDA